MAAVGFITEKMLSAISSEWALRKSDSAIPNAVKDDRISKI
jgi:hypothetical protein